MEKSNQNPVQYEWGPFFLEDGKQIFDIRYDYIFKAVFTKEMETSRSALSKLISSLIGRAVEVDVITANEPPNDYVGQKHVRLDISCRTKEGEIVNVEMSLNPSAVELKRLEYYEARLFVGQDIYGNKKGYDDLKETYQITLLAEKKFFQDENLMHKFIYYDPDTQVSLGGKTRIITVELIKTKAIIEKTVEEMTKMELWAAFFQYLTDGEKRAKINEIIKREEGIAMAVTTMGSFTQSEIEYFREMSREKSELDWQDHLTQAYRTGCKDNNLEIARKMKTMGFLQEQIQDLTGLSADDIT